MWTDDDESAIYWGGRLHGGATEGGGEMGEGGREGGQASAGNLAR